MWVIDGLSLSDLGGYAFLGVLIALTINAPGYRKWLGLETRLEVWRLWARWMVVFGIAFGILSVTENGFSVEAVEPFFRSIRVLVIISGIAYAAGWILRPLQQPKA